MSPIAKYKNQELAEKLYPLYLEHGTIQAVFAHCIQTGIALTKPTLAKMARQFGWKNKRADEIKTNFVTPTATGNLLVNQLVEIEACKTEFRKVLATSPLDRDANTQLGAFLRIELDVIKQLTRTEQKEEAISAVDEAVKSKGLSPQFAADIKASLRSKPA